jgi:phage-related minor tail protein
MAGKKTASGANLEVGTSVDRSGIDEAKRALGELGPAAGAAGQQASAGLDQIPKAAGDAANKIERETSRIEAALRRNIAAGRAGGSGTAAYYQELANTKGISADRIRPLLDELREVERANDRVVLSNQRVGVSAGQTANALRQVPAQFTDIFTSLASGQSPLLVALQQGGQLKDSFGGAGAAALALGSYVLRLINPVAALATTVVAGAAAFIVGAKEAQEYAKALVLTGNVAGTTSAQLAAVAAAVEASGAGTQRQAAAAISEFVKTAAIGAGDLERFTAAAVRLQTAGGPAVKETAAALVELSKGPAEASKRLNETTNFLTAAVFGQIKALQDAGRNTDAARVAQEAYVASITERAPQLEQRLGAIERAWKAIKEATAGAVDAALEIGRPDNAGEALARQQAEVVRLRGLTAGGLPLPRDVGAFARGESVAQRVAEAERMLEQMRSGLETEKQRAEATAKRAAAERAGIKWLEDGEKSLTRQQRLALEIERIRNSGRNAPNADLGDIERRVALARAVADPGLSTQRAQDRAAQAAEANKRAVQEIQTLQATGRLREIEGIERTSAAALRDFDARRQALVAELAFVARRQDTEREQEALRGQLALLDRQRSNEVARARDQITVAAYRQAQAIDAVVRAQREEIEQEQAAYFVEQSKAREAVARAITEYGSSLDEEAERLRIEASLLGQSQSVRDARLAQFRVELELKRRLADIDRTDFQDGETGRERERLRAREAAAREVAISAQRTVVEEAGRTADKVQSSLTDALMRAFERGSSFAEVFADSIRDLFKTLVLRPAVELVVQPAANLVLQLLGSLGLGGAAGGLGLAAGGAGGGGAAGALQLVSTGRTAFGLANAARGYGAAASGYFDAFATSAAGRQLGLSSLTQDAAGNIFFAQNSTGAAVGSAAGLIGGAAAGIYGGRAVSGGFSTGGSGNSNVNLGTAIGAIWGPIGAALGGLIGGVVNRAFGRQNPEIQAQGFMGRISGGDFTGESFADILQRGGWFRSDRRFTDTAALPAEVDRAIDTQARQILISTQEYARVLGLPAEQLRNVSADIRVAIGDDAKANTEAVQTALSGYSTALLESFRGSLEAYTRYGETLADTVTRLVGLQEFTRDLSALGGIFGTVAQQSIAAREELIAMAGGVDQLRSLAGNFAQQYYSRDEIAGIKARDVRLTLQDLGLSTEVNTRAQFRSLVEGLDPSSTEGRQQLTTLLGIAGDFAQVADYLAETQRSLSDAAAQAPATGIVAGLLGSPVQVAQLDALTASQATLVEIRDELRLYNENVAQLAGGGVVIGAPVFEVSDGA